MIIKRSRRSIHISRKAIFYITYSLLLVSLGIRIQRFGTIGNVIIPYFKSEKRKINNFIKPFSGEMITIDIPFDEFEKLKKIKNNASQSGLLQNLDYVSCKIKNYDKIYPAKID